MSTIHRIQLCLLSLLAGASWASEGVSTNRLAPLPIHTQIAARLAEKLPVEHISHQPVDDSISERTWENYLRYLDSSRIYFLQEDVDRFEEHITNLDDMIKDGDLSFAYDVYEIFRERLRDRVAFVQKQIEKGFDLTLEESFRWDRKDAPYASNQEEWDDLWRRLLKHQYLQRIVPRELAEEAKEEEKDTAENRDEPPEPPADGPDDLSATNTIPAGTNSVASATPPPTPEEVILKRFDNFLDVMENADSVQVLERFMTALTTSYDPHCSYMSPASEENFDISMRLSLVGIGAMLRQEDGALKIERLLPGGPAERDERDIRLQVDDKIIAVAQENKQPVDIMHWPISKAVALIRGEKGTRVVLTVIPATDPSESTTKIVDLIRDEIKLEERAAKHEIVYLPTGETESNKLAVIDLPSFYADLKGMSDDPDNYKSCARDIKKILEDLQDDDVDGVLIDLRNNGGGALREVVTMTGFFIRSGPVVLVSKGRELQALPDRDPSVLYRGPLVILINRMSASASEILAAALQDYGRAIIVGDSRSYGKGSVQSVSAVDRGNNRMGAVKLTNSMFFRVSGSSTQLKGVTSDISIPSFSELLDIGESFRTHALPWRMVRGAGVTPGSTLRQAVPVLEEKAMARRANDSRFGAYSNLLYRIDELNDMEEQPLNLEKRLELARERKTIADEQKALVKNDDEEENPNGDIVKGDIVLNEALHILSDLATLLPEPERPEPPVRIPFRRP